MFGSKTKQITELNIQIGRLAVTIRQLNQLARGCKRHPNYRAIRRPNQGCDICHNMHEIASLLRKDKTIDF